MNLIYLVVPVFALMKLRQFFFSGVVLKNGILEQTFRIHSVYKDPLFNNVQFKINAQAVELQ